MTPLHTLLSRLSSSSRHVIVDGQVGKLSDLQKFLHVKRPPELQLLDLVKSSPADAATVIFLCGNVGDGKSHLLSYLRESGDLGNFEVHNDATESFDPSKTNLETLVERVLTDFSDSRIESSSKQLVLAINLGVLANLYDEINGTEYSKLSSYIEDSKLLERMPSDFPSTRHFAHVDFTASPVVDFNSEEVCSPLFRDLLDRIFAKDSQNPFYEAFRDSSSDDISTINYEFLLNEQSRRAFERLLIQAVVKHKVVFSVREFLDFLSDCIVGRGGALAGSVDDRIRQFLPFSLFESSDSPLHDAFRKSDPVQIRSARADERMFEIAAVNSQVKRLAIAFSYEVPSWVPNDDDNTHLRLLCKLQQRLDFFANSSGKEAEDVCYTKFLRILRSVSAFKNGGSPDSTLKSFIETVSNACSCWNGDPHKAKHVVLRPPGPKDKYRLLRQFELRAGGEASEIELTNHDFTVQFRINGAHEQRRLRVDFELYRMLYKVSRGYLPNRYDQLACVSLSAFVETIITAGLDNADIFVDQINDGGEIEFAVTQSGFGLQFNRML